MDAENHGLVVGLSNENHGGCTPVWAGGRPVPGDSEEAPGRPPGSPCSWVWGQAPLLPPRLIVLVRNLGAEGRWVRPE